MSSLPTAHLPPNSQKKSDDTPPGKAQSRPSFLNLPPELRLQIYSHLNFNVQYIAPQRIPRSGDEPAIDPTPSSSRKTSTRNHTPILRVCRLIYNEALPAIYSRSSLEIDFDVLPQLVLWSGPVFENAEMQTKGFFDGMPLLWKRRVAGLRVRGRFVRSFRENSRDMFREFVGLRWVEVWADVQCSVRGGAGDVSIENSAVMASRQCAISGQMVEEMKVTGVVLNKGSVAIDGRVNGKDWRGIRWSMLQKWALGLEDQMLDGSGVDGAKSSSGQSSCPARFGAYRRLFERGVSNESVLDPSVGRWILLREDEGIVETWSAEEKGSQPRLCKVTYRMTDA